MVIMAQKLSRQMKFDNTYRFLNIKAKVSEDGHGVSVPIAGLPYSCLTATGVPSLWELTKLLTIGHYFSGNGEYIISPRSKLWNMQDGKAMFLAIRNQSITISETFYQKAALHMPMNMVLTRGHYTKKSLSFVITLEDAKSKEALVTNERYMMYLDPDTKRPVEIPDTIKQLYKPARQDSAVQILAPPSGAFEYEVRVSHSDLDQQLHTTNSSYFQYCIDAFTDMCVGKVRRGSAINEMHDGRGSKINEMPIPPDRVRYVKALHQGESFAGDVLKVFAWKDETIRYLVHFQINNKSKPVVFCSMNFYNDLQSRL